jgi:hypothetical protein
MHASGPEFAGNRLADALRVVRRRIVVNRWLQQWVAWSNWVLAALIVLAAVLRFLKAPLIAGVAAILAAGLLAYLKTWYQRPSTYQAAQRFDTESRQNDRVSTAVHFWTTPEPSAMILQQREDALNHAAKVDAESLFPVEMPKRLAWTAGLAVAFAALCVYHANYGAPLPALSHKVAESKTLSAILSPISRMLESANADSGKTSATTPDSERRDASEAQKPPEPMPGSDAAKAAAALFADQEQQKNSEPGNGPPKGTMSPSGERQNAQVGQSNANDPNNQGTHGDGSSQGASDKGNNDNNNQGQGTANPGNKLTAMAQRALQALQNMVQDALGKQANSNGPSDTPSSPQAKNDDSKGAPGGPQSSAAAGQPSKGPPEKGDGADLSTSNSHGQISGVGNATQNWQLQPGKDKLVQSTLTPEHVALQSNGFKGPPGKDRSDVGAGTAQVPLQNVAPPTVATVNGAGQDTVPARYQQYVRDYFQLGKR